MTSRPTSRIKLMRAIVALAAASLPSSSAGFASRQTGVHADDLAHYSTTVRISNDIEISLYTPTMFRITVSKLPGDKFPTKFAIPFAIGKLTPWAPVPNRHWSQGEEGWVETGSLRIRVSLKGHSWQVWTHDGKQLIYPSSGPAYGMFRDGYTVFDSASALGQPSSYGRYSHWFYNPATGRYVDTYVPEDLIFDQFFIYGPGYPALFQQLNELVGPEPMLPKKAYGFFQTQHLGCNGSQTKLMQVAERLRKDHIPVDTIIVDYEWGDGCPGGDQDDQFWGGLNWSKSYQVPLSPQQMIAKLHDMHLDLMLIHHSVPDFPGRADFVKREPGREWTSKTYNADLWWSKLHEQLAIGVDGTWQDTRKNDVTDSTIWQGLQNYFGTSRRVLFMGNRNMVQADPWSLKRDDRVPSSSLLASRRYPFRWTGDAQTTWSELQWEIDAITNTYGAMEGVSYITADAFGADWKQQARWSQFLSFAPIARSHTMKPWDGKQDVRALTGIMAFGDKRTTPPTDFDTPHDDGTAQPSNAAHPQPSAEASIREHLAMRYRLLPYIYSEAYHHYRTGFPIARPMVLAFPDDPHCKFNRWPYQYMFGDSFLVAPVWADLNSMEIYLPAGQNWIDYRTKAVYPGGQTINYDTSDINNLPVFVKAGSIIPMRPDAEWIDPTRHADPLTLDIFPSTAPATYTLYEDDGVSTLYQSGQFSTTHFEAQAEANGNVEVKLGESTGSYSGKPRSRAYLVNVNLIANAPLGVSSNGKSLSRIDDPAAFARAISAWRYDANLKMAQIKLPLNATDHAEIDVAGSREASVQTTKAAGSLVDGFPVSTCPENRRRKAASSARVTDRSNHPVLLSRGQRSSTVALGARS